MGDRHRPDLSLQCLWKHGWLRRPLALPTAPVCPPAGRQTGLAGALMIEAWRTRVTPHHAGSHWDIGNAHGVR